MNSTGAKYAITQWYKSSHLAILKKEFGTNYGMQCSALSDL